MDHSATILHCTNLECGTANPRHHDVCGNCGLPLVKRYLWSLSPTLMATESCELLAQRYLICSPHVVLDTQPGLAPDFPDEIPHQIQPYLRLLPYRLNLPQVYGFLPRESAKTGQDLWFLEYSSVPLNASGELTSTELFLPLTKLWQEASTLRRLHWLWQMAKLWAPLRNQGVVSSLLNPTLLKGNGPVLQLQQLQLDDIQRPPRLRSLGELWLSWLAQSPSALDPYLRQLCDAMVNERLINPEEIVECLDQALQRCGTNQQRNWRIIAITDKGPTRSGNEDACFPVEDEIQEPEAGMPAFAIVCDGLGGHEGGEIASQMAVDTVSHTLQHIGDDPVLAQKDTWRADLMGQKLRQAVSSANNRISDHNDRLQTEDRNRMGTTIVMALAQAHEIYLTHVGDSRIYWITPHGCHLMTLDDDLATREVHLGYALYRDILKYPSAGALIQALGMSDSSQLYPTTSRVMLDEDCVFLLCSDGLSDRDRVEQFWRQEIQPIFSQKISLQESCQRLIAIANQYNGHDNVTVALLHCQVHPGDTDATAETFVPLIEALKKFAEGRSADQDPEIDTDITNGDKDVNESAPTEVNPAREDRPVVPIISQINSPSPSEIGDAFPDSFPALSTQSRFPQWLIILLVVLLCGGIGLFLWRQRSEQQQRTSEHLSDIGSISASLRFG